MGKMIIVKTKEVESHTKDLYRYSWDHEVERILRKITGFNLIEYKEFKNSYHVWAIEG